ncbi:MAG: TonB C-terminal domain-containing protein [Endomicrobium sp.]|jgi:TonB family protein|nr:TonB C-terminal domain-containing protein [Endomicrobium sp.]
MEELSTLSPPLEESSVNNAEDARDIKESAKEDIKEQIKEIAKTKDDVLVKKKKKPIKKDVQENKDKNIKNTKKTESVKKDPSKPSVSVETAQPLEYEVLSDDNGSLYTGPFFDTNDFKYPYYANQIRRKVAAKWRWTKSYSSGLRVLLYFRINRNGSVGDILVKESSDNEDYDKNALYTIRRASPFSELPEGYGSESLGVFFEFKY